MREDQCTTVDSFICFIAFQLRYSFYDDENGDVSRNFSIDATTGLITTKTTFDLEAFPQGVIRFTVMVNDSVPSVDPFVPEGRPNSGQCSMNYFRQAYAIGGS